MNISVRRTGVSPVIGIILLTAVTVALVSLAAFFVFDVGSSSSSGVGASTVTAEYESESKIDVQLLKQGSSDRVIVRSALGTEYVLDETGETVTLLNQDSNQTPLVLSERDGDKTVIREVPPQSFTADIVVAKEETGDYSNLSKAIKSVQDGEIIVVKKDTYYQNIDIKTPNVTLVGESGTVISDNSTSDSSVIDVQSSGVRVSNIEVDANTSNGGTAADYGISTSEPLEVSSTAVNEAGIEDINGDVSRVSPSEFIPRRALTRGDTDGVVPDSVSEVLNRSYNQSGSDRLRDVAVAGKNSIVVAGSVEQSDGDIDGYLAKYSTSGDKKWQQIYDFSGGYDEARGVSVDNSGNIVVTGIVTQSSGNEDILVRKFNTSGDRILNKTFDKQGLSDQAYDVAVDDKNNIIVVGETESTNADTDIVTVKYSSNGNKKWSRTFDQVDKTDTGRSIAVDSQNNIAVTGWVKSSRGDSDFEVIKYNPEGTKLWNRTYDLAEGRDRPVGLAVDNDNAIVAVGMLNGPNGGNELGIIKYSPDGTEQFNVSYDHEGGIDAGRQAVIDGNNNIIIGGRVTQADGDVDFGTWKFTERGELIWVETYDKSNSFNRGYSVTVNGNGSVFTVGAGDGDHLIVKYG